MTRTRPTPTNPGLLWSERVARTEPDIAAPRRHTGLRAVVSSLALLLLGATGLGADCDPEREADIALYPMTGAPPTRVARVQEADKELGRAARIQLSRGAILSVRCWDNCDYTCVAPDLVPGDAAVLSVAPLDRLNSTTPEFALIAHAAGATTLRVISDCAEKTYRVEVE